MVFNKLLKEYKKIWALGVAKSSIYYDLTIFSPKESIKDKGEALGILSTLKKQILTSKTFLDLFEKAKKQANSDFEKGVIRVLERELDYYLKIPEDFMVDYNKLISKSSNKWLEAKKKSNFKIFKPYLEQIIEYSKKLANFLNSDKEPYDVLLDLFDEGMNMKKLDSIFAIKKELKHLLDKVLENEWPEESRLKDLNYDKAKLRLLIVALLRSLGFDFNRGRIDYYEHPFTSNITNNDVRITFNNKNKDFADVLTSVIHEFGHAIYDLQIDEKLAKTPVSSQENMSIHESQSRFWENIIGRSKEFMSFLLPLIKEFLNIDTDEDELFYYFNLVKPSLIRTKADELTYNFHIFIRYEIEKAIFKEEVSVKELPELWNDLYEKYLGIKPNNDKEGILQDVHWSEALFGYFPSYTLGNLLSAQIMFKIKDFNNLLSEKNFAAIRLWLKENIHKHGNIYPPEVLIKKALGEDLNPDYFIKYLKTKYLKV